VDYFWVDRRLGNNEDLKALVEAYHRAGIRVILDAVFNHSGRHFFAFKGLQEGRENSPYRDWYSGLDFSRTSPLGDPFSYEGWAGCYDLVKFNGESRELRDHLFEAAEFWIGEFDIDGLRLDAAADLLPGFMDELAALCRKARPGFWLLGEVVAGDYRNWAGEKRLDSVTNYELYKGLWSCFNDKNFFELAWTLNRQWGREGMYRDIALYNFADNHDVNRVAGTLTNKSHLFPLYGILFCLPGVPSIYYGSEFGIAGERTKESDRALRPRWNPGWVSPSAGEEAGDTEAGAPALFGALRDFIKVRRENPCLQEGSYRQVQLSHEQFAFMREQGPDQVLVAVNAAAKGHTLHIPGEALRSGKSRWRDLLTGEEFPAASGGITLPLHPSYLRILG
ncbi:MAG: alpha-glucosidase C-terminal domain-containing protein, partial [Treponema sp.]|jgi:glycosidase|nr:alpha-glucosidase C-terminal domain-containing protein [Treponema sp.]